MTTNARAAPKTISVFTEKSGPFSSIRIVLDWRRKHPAVDASGVSRAGRACLTVRRAKRLCMTSIPRFADVGSPVLFRRGMCRRDHSNNRQRSCVHRQCEEPYRKFAHASLPLMRKRSWIGSGSLFILHVGVLRANGCQRLIAAQARAGCRRSRAFIFQDCSATDERFAAAAFTEPAECLR
jgi:hypothetical protein